jgi:hypothetical protein
VSEESEKGSDKIDNFFLVVVVAGSLVFFWRENDDDKTAKRQQEHRHHHATKEEMVKGNWERRAELANVKRQEARERKQLKKSGKVVNPESVLQKLFKDTTLRAGGARVEVYVAHPDAGVVCKTYLRTADCRVKRCRLLHDEGVSVSHLRNMQASGGEEFTASSTAAATAPATVCVESSTSVPEKRCSPCAPLDEVMPLKDWNTLMFVAIDGECVYDYTTSDVWNEWIAAYRVAAQKSGSLPTVDEDGDEENGGDDSDGDHKGNDERPQSADECESNTKRRAEKGTKAAVEVTAGSTERNPLFRLLSSTAAIHLFMHLTVADLLCSLLPCSKGVKLCVLRDEGFRVRRREALSLVTRDLSKRKKDEKRKKVKNANVKKVDKKDAFARGGPGR